MEDDDAYIRELIEIVLFTEPGECVNHPDFGVGLNEYVFMPSTPLIGGSLMSSSLAAVEINLLVAAFSSFSMYIHDRARLVCAIRTILRSDAVC